MQTSFSGADGPSSQPLWSQRQTLIGLCPHPGGLGDRGCHLAPDRLRRAVGFEEPVLSRRCAISARRLRTASCRSGTPTISAAIPRPPIRNPCCSRPPCCCSAGSCPSRRCRLSTSSSSPISCPARSPSCPCSAGAAGIRRAPSSPPSSSCSAARPRPGCSIRA